MTLRFLVSGMVQGVGFRYFVHARAGNLGLRGWVRNLPDGRVEVVAAGEAEALGTLEGWLQDGPSRARVADVEKLEISQETELPKSFTIM